VGIAIVQDVQRAVLRRARNLLEERNQSASAFERTCGMRGSRAYGLERHVAHLRRNSHNRWPGTLLVRDFPRGLFLDWFRGFLDGRRCGRRRPGGYREQ
jgi:hypothetical protein